MLNRPSIKEASARSWRAVRRGKRPTFRHACELRRCLCLEREEIQRCDCGENQPFSAREEVDAPGRSLWLSRMRACSEMRVFQDRERLFAENRPVKRGTIDRFGRTRAHMRFSPQE